MNKKKDILWRIWAAFIVVCLFGAAIAGKTVHTQLVEGEEWLSMADSLTIFTKTIDADRGNIYSDDGRLLATSLPYFEVRIDFKSEPMTNEIFEQNVDSLAIVLSKKIGAKSYEGYKNDLIANRNRGNRYYLVKKKVTFPELQTMKQWAFFRLGRYKSGMIVIENQSRTMPFGLLAQRTIGYIRDDERYKVGLEGMFHEELSGEKGQLLVQKIAGNTHVPLQDKKEISPKPGLDLYTTIDVNIQDVAESALLRALETHNADHGCVVLMEVKTGKIRAIANLGKTSSGYYSEIKNYAVADATEPGSTFKLASMIAMLEDGLIDVDDEINLENGKTTFYDRTMKDAYPPRENVVTIGRAFELSSNVGIAKLANEHYAHNKEKLRKHFVKMRLDKQVGIEIVGEPNPIIKPVSEWSGVSVPWMSTGYEITLTPLQMLTFYNAVANNGKMVKPYLVSEIKEYQKVVKSFEPVVLENSICSESTVKTMNRLLVGVVDNGTAKKVKNDNFKIAAKTGTSQIYYDGAYQKIYQSSIAGYFPADNPLYSCIVVINEPSEGVYYGGAVAGPVFKEIADKVYSSEIEMHEFVNDEAAILADDKGIIKKGDAADMESIYDALTVKYKEANEDAVWAVSQTGGKKVSLQNLTNNEGLAPNLSGMGLRDALYLLETKGVNVKILGGKGKVVKQSVAPGERLLKGDKIVLTLG